MIRKIGKIVLRTFLILLLILPLLLVAVLVSLRFQPVQNYIAAEAAAYLSRETGAEVRIGSVFAGLGGAHLENIYIEDLRRDTLLYARSIDVRYDAAALLSRKVSISAVSISGLDARISRRFPDTLYNFSFIPLAFAGAQETEPAAADTSKGAWEIKLGRILIEHSRVIYSDNSSGNLVSARIGHFSADVSRFDPDGFAMAVRSVSLANSTADVMLSPALLLEEDEEEQEESDARIDAGNIALQNISLAYHDSAGGSRLLAHAGRLDLRDARFALLAQEISVKSLSLKNSNAAYRQLVVSSDTMKAKELDEEMEGRSWTIRLSELGLKENKFSYDNEAAPKLQQGFDHNHMQLSALGMDAKELLMAGDSISVRLQDMKLRERSGFELKQFRSALFYGPRQIRATAMSLVTGNSSIGDHFVMSYPSLAAFTASPEIALLQLHLQSSVDLRDLRIFAPDLFNDSILKKDARGIVSLHGHISGSLAALSFDPFELQGPGLRVNVKGTIRNMTAPQELYAEIPTLQVKTGKPELFALINPRLLGDAFNLPDTVQAEAAFKGYLRNFDASLRLFTSSGSMIGQVKMDPAAGNTEQGYIAHFGVDALDLGYLLKQPATLGRVSLMADVAGRGFDTSSLDTKIDLSVVQASVLGYNYTNLDMKGHFLKKSFTGKAGMNDKNLAFDFDGSLTFDPGRTAFHGRLHLRGADLKQLHLSTQDLRVSLLMNADMDYIPGENPEGTVRVSDILLIKQQRRHMVDSLVIRSTNHEKQNELSVRSDVLVADLKGRYLLDELGGKMMQHVNSYFNFVPAINDSAYAAQDYTLSLDVVNPAIFSAGLVPGLSQLTPVSVKAAFNSSSRAMSLDAQAPRIVYQGVQMDSLRVQVSSDAERLEYSTTLAQLSDSTFRFENLFAGGKLKNNTASFGVHTTKDDSTKLMSLGGMLSKVTQDYQLRLDSGLILNGESWQVDPKNLVEFTKAGVYAEHVTISRDDHLVSLASASRSHAAPLEIRFRNFEIATISKLIENRQNLFAGNAEGYVQLEQAGSKAAFRSDLTIRNFVYSSVPIGNISLQADNYEDVKKYDVFLGVKGGVNDLDVKGSYNTGVKSNSLRFSVAVRRLDLATVEPFTGGQLTRMSGALYGNLEVRGEPQRPEVTGSLHPAEAFFNPRIIDSYLKIPSGELVFESGKMKLNNLVFYDTLENKASLNGFVNIADLEKISYDLRVKTDDFLAMNTNRKSNPLYFGRVFLKSDIRLSGTPDLPVIDVKARLNKGSRLTYVKPESQLTKDEASGVVEFTDSLHQYSTIMQRTDTAFINNMQGVELNAVIEVDRSVDIRMIVDPLAGDSLFLQGGGTLDFSLDRSGKTTLTGKYTIQDGGYYLTISDFVKRDFRIRKGSSVTWSGDMLDAYLDLDAIYRLKASPIDLVQAQMAGVSELEMNKYRNLLTFDVFLKMTGFISNPAISFDIQLAPEDKGAMNGAVNTRLAQLREDESQMNKQVFALLTLKRFIGENPLESGGESGFSSASRSSASKVLTQQLSTLSDRYVNFVDLDLGVNSYEDYSSGQQEGRTQLQVGVSKQIFNDRVTVRVGGNVELEGEKSKQNNANDVAGNISIDYKLTEDGRYKLKAFRENQYENPIEGELTKTGAGFIFTRDFNKFKNLFRKSRRGNAAERNK